jgi:mono/diheme cytochrome c family protein
LPANIPVTFEGTILFSALTAFFGMWTLNRLPRYWHPFFRSERFHKLTDDGFFLGIQADDKRFDPEKTVALLRDAGASHVELIHLDPDPAQKRIPRALLAFVAVTTVLALIPFALIARSRATRSDKPHVHLIADMDFQFKTKAQQASGLFGDGRGTRLPVAGTVARGDLRDDDHFYRGIVKKVGDAGAGGDGGQRGAQIVDAWATTFPARFEVDEAAMERGRERYNIYCQPCHGQSGYGTGMIDKRAKKLTDAQWTPPTSLHLPHIVTQPHGQLFNTISNGIRSMQPYASQIPEADRWAIILYVRALQRSQLAKQVDVPEGKLKATPAPAPAPTGAAPGAAPTEPAPAGTTGQPTPTGTPAPGAAPAPAGGAPATAPPATTPPGGAPATAPPATTPPAPAKGPGASPANPQTSGAPSSGAASASPSAPSNPKTTPTPTGTKP